MNDLKIGSWNLADLKYVKKNGLKVFSCFHCGGGSTMGYKLAGYEVLGGVEIDPKMMDVYKTNHNPKHSYLMGVQEFKNIPNDKLPKELFELDILDGSPPCSSFSMAGSREDGWQEEKVFREGQANQILDDLFFDFIDIAKKLQPKVVIPENVKGLVSGKARGYVKQIFKKFKEAGYETQLFVLNSSRMGVPQKRERTFFISNRIGKKIKLEFNEDSVNFIDISEPISIERSMVPNGIRGAGKWCLRNGEKEIFKWNKAKRGKTSGFTQKMALFNEPLLTQTASGRHIYPGTDFFLSDKEVIRGQSFPEDYNFLNNDPAYICGMSVPPFMMQRVADQVYKQMFNEKTSLVENINKTPDANNA